MQSQGCSLSNFESGLEEEGWKTKLLFYEENCLIWLPTECNRENETPGLEKLYKIDLGATQDTKYPLIRSINLAPINERNPAETWFKDATLFTIHNPFSSRFNEGFDRTKPQKCYLRIERIDFEKRETKGHRDLLLPLGISPHPKQVGPFFYMRSFDKNKYFAISAILVQENREHFFLAVLRPNLVTDELEEIHLTALSSSQDGLAIHGEPIKTQDFWTVCYQTSC